MQELQKLKVALGRKPFDDRLTFENDFAKCPFHDGQNKTLHLYRMPDGVWIATCFSGCLKTLDAISFVSKFDGVSIGDAIRRLCGREREWSKPAKKLRPIPQNPALPWEKVRAMWILDGLTITPQDEAFGQRLEAERKSQARS